MISLESIIKYLTVLKALEEQGFKNVRQSMVHRKVSTSYDYSYKIRNYLVLKDLISLKPLRKDSPYSFVQLTSKGYDFITSINKILTEALKWVKNLVL